MRRTTRSTRSGSRVLTDPAISEISGARTTRARCARSRPGVLIAECGSQATAAPYPDTAMRETVHETYSGSSVSQGGRRGQTRPDRPPAPGRAAEHPAGRVGDVGPPAPTGPGIGGGSLAIALGVSLGLARRLLVAAGRPGGTPVD